MKSVLIEKTLKNMIFENLRFFRVMFETFQDHLMVYLI